MEQCTSKPEPKTESKAKPKPKKKRFVVKKKAPNPSPSMTSIIAEYEAQLCETEKIALKIAHHQLESSFCIEKSIGFLNFLESRKN